MPGLIGKKIGMTSIFSEEGKNIPCTILEVGPCKVTQVKTEEIDGYNAIQLGFADQKEFYSPLFYDKSSRLFDSYGAIDWQPELKLDSIIATAYNWYKHHEKEKELSA